MRHKNSLATLSINMSEDLHLKSYFFLAFIFCRWKLQLTFRIKKYLIMWCFINIDMYVVWKENFHVCDGQSELSSKQNMNIFRAVKKNFDLCLGIDQEIPLKCLFHKETCNFVNSEQDFEKCNLSSWCSAWLNHTLLFCEKCLIIKHKNIKANSQN